MAVLITASANLGHVARMFAGANGHRPFLLGYFLASVILVAGAVSEVYDYPDVTLSVLRIALALTLTGTLLWASFRGGKP